VDTTVTVVDTEVSIVNITNKHSYRPIDVDNMVMMMMMMMIIIIIIIISEKTHIFYFHT
jgi:hypothetical protein